MGYNKVIYNKKTLIDLTICTVTPETLAEGATAYNAAGNLITGAAVVIGTTGASSYTGIVGKNKIIYAGKTLIDLTMCTVTPESLAQGVTAYDAAGNLIAGIAAMADVQKSSVYTGVIVRDVTTERHIFNE